MLRSVAAHVMELVTGDSQIPRASGASNLDHASGCNSVPASRDSALDIPIE